MSARLSIADQVLINAAGCVNARIVDRADDALVISIISEVLPHVTRSIPEIRKVAEACEHIVAHADRSDGAAWCSATMDLSAALLPLFRWRLGGAHEVWQRQSQPELFKETA